MNSPDLTCPACGQTHRQTKAGKTPCGSQRYQYFHCKRFYTPAPKAHGYPRDLHLLALRMYLEDGNFRRIARLLGVHHQTVINWVNASHAALKERGTTPPQPDTVETAELDELWTFVGSKKTVLPRHSRRPGDPLPPRVLNHLRCRLGEFAGGGRPGQERFTLL